MNESALVKALAHSLRWNQLQDDVRYVSVSDIAAGRED
jgi:hypothetical protein